MEGSDRSAADQARPLAFALLLLLGACDGQTNPRALYRDMSGAGLASRGMPPGMDRRLPNLASVPPIPERPDSATRDALTRRLEAEREASTAAVPAARPQFPLTEPEVAGHPPIPARPPGPPVLAAAPAIPWAPARATRPVPAAGEPSARPPELLGPESVAPGAIPALPTPDLLAPAPAQPGRPSVEQLAPSEAPAMPSSDLLAPPPPR